MEVGWVCEGGFSFFLFAYLCSVAHMCIVSLSQDVHIFGQGAHVSTQCRCMSEHSVFSSNSPAVVYWLRNGEGRSVNLL